MGDWFTVLCVLRARVARIVSAPKSCSPKYATAWADLVNTYLMYWDCWLPCIEKVLFKKLELAKEGQRAQDLQDGIFCGNL